MERAIFQACPRRGHRDAVRSCLPNSFTPRPAGRTPQRFRLPESSVGHVGRWPAKPLTHWFDCCSFVPGFPRGGERKGHGTLDDTAGGQTLLKERPLVISFKLAAIKLLKSQTRGADFVALAALLTERGVAKGGPPRSFWGILVYRNNSDEEKCLKK